MWFPGSGPGNNRSVSMASLMLSVCVIRRICGGGKENGFLVGFLIIGLPISPGHVENGEIMVIKAPSTRSTMLRVALSEIEERQAQGHSTRFTRQAYGHASSGEWFTTVRQS